MIELLHQAGWETPFQGAALSIFHSKQAAPDSPCLWHGAGDIPNLCCRNLGGCSSRRAGGRQGPPCWSLITPCVWEVLHVKPLFLGGFLGFFPFCCFVSLSHTAGPSSAPLPKAFPLDNSDCNLFCRLLSLWPLNSLNFWHYFCWHVGKSKAIEKTAENDAKTTFIYWASSAPRALCRANQNYSHLMPFPHPSFSIWFSLLWPWNCSAGSAQNSSQSNKTLFCLAAHWKRAKNCCKITLWISSIYLGLTIPIIVHVMLKCRRGAERFWSFPLRRWNLQDLRMVWGWKGF